MSNYEPKGTRFLDLNSGREMILVAEGGQFAGWICYRHPDGQWVTLRKANERDRRLIGLGMTRTALTQEPGIDPGLVRRAIEKLAGRGPLGVDLVEGAGI